MQLTGAEIVIECLKEQGVDTVFGYPGGTILNIYDALYKHSDEIHHILTAKMYLTKTIFRTKKLKVWKLPLVSWICFT